MPTKIGINGFGRIGRCVLRAQAGQLSESTPVRVLRVLHVIPGREPIRVTFAIAEDPDLPCHQSDPARECTGEASLVRGRMLFLEPRTPLKALAPTTEQGWAFAHILLFLASTALLIAATGMNPWAIPLVGSALFWTYRLSRVALERNRDPLRLQPRRNPHE